MKKLFFFSIASLFMIGQVFSQTTLTVNATAVNASICTPPCNGTATANASGGTPPYTYAWGTSPVQNGPNATGLCPGTYSVGVTDATTPFPNFGGATVTLTCVQGVNEYVLNNFLEVYPNPVSGTISITLSYPNGGEVKEVSVFNSIGEKVLSENYSSKKFNHSLYVGNLPSGTYFMDMKDEKNTYRTKFVKQ